MRMLSDAELAQLLDKDIFHNISDAADTLGLECYVVGGYVRDLFLERPSNDIDVVVVVGSGISIAEALKQRLGKRARLSVFRNFGTAQVKFGGLEVEFVGARKESYSHDSRKPIVEDGTLEDDQNRRDFTINALAVCLNKARFGELVDPFDGLADLEDGIIRTPLDPDITFSDDPLRMLRCVRFAAQLNFFIEDETFDALTRNADRIQIISGERIQEELNKIMMTAAPSKGFVDLYRCGLLPRLLPELTALDIVEKRNGRAHKNNFYHTLEVLDNVSRQSDNLWLRWAALLHDIGKPKTKRWNNAQGWTFHNHNFVGSKMVPDIFRRLKLPMDAKMKYVARPDDAVRSRHNQQERRPQKAFSRELPHSPLEAARPEGERLQATASALHRRNRDNGHVQLAAFARSGRAEKGAQRRRARQPRAQRTRAADGAAHGKSQGNGIGKRITTTNGSHVRGFRSYFERRSIKLLVKRFVKLVGLSPEAFYHLSFR